MDMYRLAELLERGTEGDVGRDFLYEVGSVGTKDVGAKDAALARLCAELHHSLRFPHCQSLTVSAIEGLVTLEGRAGFLQLILGGTRRP